MTDQYSDWLFMRGSLPVESLEPMLQGWSEGLIQLGNVPLATSNFPRPEFRNLGQWNSDDFSLGWPEITPYHCFVVHAHGIEQLENLAQPQDIMTIAKTLSFRGVDELTLDRLHFRVGNSYATHVLLLAPLQIGMSGQVTANKVMITVRVHEGISTQDLFLNTRIEDLRGNRVVPDSRFPLGPSVKAWGGNFRVLVDEHEYPSGAAREEAHL
ncbi:MAG: hypothetical protein EXR67_03695 [Dehalococcoidia bacterium]|nr:hypothetical protein [Dehalococcoidia bacterium]